MAKIEITGNLGADAEVKTPRNGGQPFLTFSVCDNKKRFNENTQKWETLATQWFNCTLFGPSGEWFQHALHKGVRVTVFGQMWMREYESQNGPGVSLDVVVDAVKVWPPKTQDERSYARRAGEQQFQQQQQEPAGWGQPAEPAWGGADDEPPF